MSEKELAVVQVQFPKPVMVVYPAAATPKARRALEQAGYVVVVAEDPAHFTVVQPDVVPLAKADLILRAALTAVSGSEYGRHTFGRALADALLADGGK